jgi:predicted house-cleaning noncanonical NTP pyrophosphatase (MazG superfamily)
MLKAVEGTTYGTLRLIQDQNGIYYIQIIEEGDSTTALNNVELYAIDYEANKGVIDAMFDVLGNPHTIKERISPIAFVDQFGNSHLNKVLSKDNIYAAVNSTEDLISYFVATFNKPSNTNHVKLMISAREVGNTLDVLYQVLQTINAQDNLWWLDEALMSDTYSNEAVQKVFDSVLKLYIEVWDGEKWITQASIDPGTYLTEEFLVELDLTNINTSDLKIRLVFPSEINYNIDSIYVDYSENVNMIVNKLDLVSATLNNEVDIMNLVNNIDNDYVYLNFKDSARLGFGSVTLAEGYERVIGVSATGYIYTSGTTIEHELKEEIENKTFNEIVEIINNSNDEQLTNYVESVTELYYLLLQLGNLEYEEIVYVLFNLTNQL